MKRILFYDCEIINDPIALGWKNFKALGICVIGCYANWLPKSQQLQYFTVDGGFEGFQALVNQADEIVGFNSISFDDPLCQAHDIHIQTTYDLMVEIRRAAGESLSGTCTRGYNLARLTEVNLGRKKTGLGSEVPALWQAGKRQEVIDYCLNDVQLLVDLYQRRTRLIDPVRYDNVVLHCDPSLTNWREIRSNLKWLVAERIGSISIGEKIHWTNSTILELRISLFESLVIKFPIWLFPDMGWRTYVGLPFDRKKARVIPLQGRIESDDDDDDPIPF